MFENFFKEKRLKNSLDKIEKKHEKFKETEKYKKFSAEERHEEDQGYYQCEYGPVCEELEVLKTKKLLKKASKLSVPFPSRWEDKEKKYWDEGCFLYGSHYLKTVGEHKLIKAIREEETARNKARIWWLPLFSAAISALSALVGVILGASIK